MSEPVILRFMLPSLTPTVNTMLRRNRYKRGKPREALAWEIKLAILAVAGQVLPITPFRHAKITVIRRSTGSPDPDGLRASCKDMIDIFQPMSSVYKCSLGIIFNDTAAVLGDGPIVIAERVRHRNLQGIWVTIEGYP